MVSILKYIILVVLIALLLYCPTSSLTYYTPDSIERIAASINYLENGNYTITVDGQEHPPRYSPAFSFLFVLPALYLSGHNPAAPIFIILIIATLGLASIYYMLAKQSSDLIALLAILIILSLASFQSLARLIMTDVPSAIFISLTLLQYLKISVSKNNQPRDYLCLGLLSSLSTLARTSNIFSIFPAILLLLFSNTKTKISKLIYLILPTALVCLSSILYNYLTFDHPLRSGYHYWVGVPYNFPSLTFNFDYIFNNFSYYFSNFEIFLPSILVVWLILYFSFFPRKNIYKSGILFWLVLTCIPIFSFYLLYFYKDFRFLLGVQISLTIIILLSLQQSFKIPKYLLVIFCLFFLVKAMSITFSYENKPSYISLRTQVIKEHIKPNSILISHWDQVSLSLFIKNMQIRFLSLDRKNEYAGKMLLSQNLKFNPGRDPLKHRSEDLKRAGAQEAVSFVALEMIEKLWQKAKEGKSIYLDIDNVSKKRYANAKAKLQSRFDLIPLASNLFKLEAH